MNFKRSTRGQVDYSSQLVLLCQDAAVHGGKCINGVEGGRFGTHTHQCRRETLAFFACDCDMLALKMISKAADAGVSRTAAVGWAIPSILLRVALDSLRFSMKRDTCAELMLLLVFQ
jgi:hypothetical protein